jgi:hypothetical protein
MEGGGVMRGNTRTCQTRGTRGAQLKVEAQADGRWWHDERQCNSHPDKRRKRGARRGGDTGGREAAA